MREKKFLGIVVCFVLAVSVAQGADAKKAKPAASKNTIVLPADLKWVDAPDAPGVKFADVVGDHTKGAYAMFIKFPAGFAAPMHTHTSDINVVIVSGTVIHGPEGKPEVRLPPGSFMKQAGGSYRHTTACDKASECVMFSESKGKFDLIPAEAAKK